MPSLALLALMLPFALSLKLGLGFWPTFLALVPLGIPPILTNSYVAVRGSTRTSSRPPAAWACASFRCCATSSCRSPRR